MQETHFTKSDLCDPNVEARGCRSTLHRHFEVSDALAEILISKRSARMGVTPLMCKLGMPREPMTPGLHQQEWLERNWDPCHDAQASLMPQPYLYPWSASWICQGGRLSLVSQKIEAKGTEDESLHGIAQALRLLGAL